MYRCHLRGQEVPPSRAGGATFEGRRCRLRGQEVPPSGVEGAACLILNKTNPRQSTEIYKEEKTIKQRVGGYINNT